MRRLCNVLIIVDPFSPSDLSADLSLTLPKSPALPLLAGMMVLVALSPLSTKLAGLLFLVLVGWACWARWRLSQPMANDHFVRDLLWLAAAVLVLRAAATLMWHDSWGSRHFEVRFALAALAVWLLWPRVNLTPLQYIRLTHALAFACWLALGLTWLKGRDTPTNPIPWAAGVSFLVCVLLARCAATELPWRLRMFWLASSVAGLGGVLLSQSRGSYGLLPWVVAVAGGVLWRASRTNAFRHRLLMAAAGLCALVGAALLVQPRLYQEPLLRMNEAQREINSFALALKQDAVRPEVLDTSVGARLYLTLKGWEAISEQPVRGYGQTRRVAWVEELGQSSQSEVIRSLRHLHNDPLNIWFEHGLLGFGSYLLSVVGLVWVAWRARAVSCGISLALAGMAWMHLSSGLTNFNTIHNYYGVMLSVCLLLTFLLGRPTPAASARA